MNNKLNIFLLLITFLLIFTSLLSAQELKIAVVSDIGGFEDGSYNEQIKSALEEMQSEFSFELETKESQLMTEYLNNINQFAEKKFDLIWGIGFTMEQAIRDSAQMYPELNFAIFDGEVNLENVLSITFSEEEAAFLAGVIAALESNNSTVGFIGGKENNIIKSYEAGFNAGVNEVNSEIEVINKYVGSFNNFNQAQEITKELDEAGADIIFYAAGASAKGIIDTAVERKIKLISIDPRDTKLASNNILTTILKNTGYIVKNTVEKIANDNYVNEIKKYGLSDNAFVIDKKQAREMMSQEVINKIEEYKNQVISGEIEVPAVP